MGDLADQIAERMREDGINTGQRVEDAIRGVTPAQGTGEPPVVHTPPPPAAEPLNTDMGGGQGDPGPIPYSRFAEVNGRYQELKPYEQLREYGIEPDSAVRLASFEAAYQQDPSGTIGALVDQLDLPEESKGGIKALLGAASAAAPAAAQVNDGTPGATGTLPAEVKEVVDWVSEQRKREQETARLAEEADSTARLTHVVDHWKSLDERDRITVPDRQRFHYITTAASTGRYQTLEELSEAARALYLEDRDITLGGAVQRRGPGSPLAVPSGGVAPALPVVPKSMAEARKLIESDIANGRFPDLVGG